MFLITPLTIIAYDSGPVSSGTAPTTSTGTPIDAASGWVRQTSGTRLFWPKKKYDELMAQLESEKKLRQAGMSWLERVDDDLRQVDAVLAAVPENVRPEYAANARRAELLKERAAAEKDQKVRTLAAEIQARRAADALKR